MHASVISLRVAVYVSGTIVASFLFCMAIVYVGSCKRNTIQFTTSEGVDDFDFWSILRPCQHDDGHKDGWSQIMSTPTNEHRFTVPGLSSTNRGRLALTSVNVPLSWPWSPTQVLDSVDQRGHVLASRNRPKSMRRWFRRTRKNTFIKGRLVARLLPWERQIQPLVSM